jgi:hypothetical protein
VTIWPSSSVLEQALLRLVALGSISLRRLMTMLRRSVVDLEDLGADLAADELADVAGRRMSTWRRAGRPARRCRRAGRP